MSQGDQHNGGRQGCARAGRYTTLFSSVKGVESPIAPFATEKTRKEDNVSEDHTIVGMSVVLLVVSIAKALVRLKSGSAWT